jgi:GNAT superfamily N-acetyltransferase
MASWEWEAFTVTDDPAQIDVDVVHDYLRRSYWAENIPRELVRRSIEHSLCFSVLAAGRQVGFARVISDRTTFAYLADVFVLEDWRGRGVSKFLVRCILAHPQLQGLRRWLLTTRDAHGLYRQFGFRPPAHPERLMEIVERDLHLRSSASPA